MTLSESKQVEIVALRHECGKHAYVAVELVDVAAGSDADVGFVHALAPADCRSAGVAAFGIKLCHVLEIDDVVLFVAPGVEECYAAIVEIVAHAYCPACDAELP